MVLVQICADSNGWWVIFMQPVFQESWWLGLGGILFVFLFFCLVCVGPLGVRSDWYEHPWWCWFEGWVNAEAGWYICPDTVLLEQESTSSTWGWLLVFPLSTVMRPVSVYWTWSLDLTDALRAICFLPWAFLQDDPSAFNIREDVDLFHCWESFTVEKGLLLNEWILFLVDLGL